MANTRGLPPADDWLIRRLQALENKVRLMEGARRLESASIGAGGLTVKGGSISIEDADGNLLLTLDADGLTATDAGRIGNHSLASPITAAADYDLQTGFAMGTVLDTYASVTFAVPAGYTSALVQGTAFLSVINNSGSAGAMGIGVRFAGNMEGGAAGCAIADGGQESATATYAATITDLGSTITVDAIGVAAPAFPAAPQMNCGLSAMVVFYR